MSSLFELCFQTVESLSGPPPFVAKIVKLLAVSEKAAQLGLWIVSAACLEILW